MSAYDFKTALRKSLNGARSRATRKGLEFTLELPKLVELYQEQDCRCALSGLRFDSLEFPGALVKRPYAVSIDRIDPQAGYTIENIQLVLVAVNFARNQWCDEVLRNISRAIASHEIAAEAEWYKTMRAKLKKLEKQLETAETAKLPALKHEIAGIKAAMTKGPSGGRIASLKAAATKHSTL